MPQSLQPSPPSSGRPGPSIPVSPARGRWSMLAIMGFALSLFACCPPVSLLGSVFGAMALQRIAQSHGILRGRRLALTASILGLCFGVAGFALWWTFSASMQRWTNESATIVVHDFVSAAQKGDANAARLQWTSDAANRLDDRALIDFGKAAADRYGPIRAFNVTLISASGGVYAASFEVAGTFSFEHGDRPGAVAFVLAPSSGFAMPLMKLKQITIDDGERGDLVLPMRDATTLSGG